MGTRIVLDLDTQLTEALDSFIASTPGENRKSIAQKAIGEYLRHRIRAREAADDLDALDIELAREAKRRMEDPDDEVIPYEQAMAELGL